MKRKHKILVAVAGIVALVLVGTAVRFKLESGSGPGDSGGSKSPLGGLFSRATAVSNLKEQMRDLRAFHPALMEFARQHDDDLPKTVAELKPYLPKQLTYLDDDRWEMPTAGKLTPLMNGKDANSTIFFQQRLVAAGKAKIVLYADGHIEYRK